MGAKKKEKPTTDINGDQSGENPNMTQYSYTGFFSGDDSTYCDHSR